MDGSSNENVQKAINSSGTLPTEVYENILQYVSIIEKDSDEHGTTRERTLIAIAISCRYLQPLAEYVLYTKPPELDSMRQRERFYAAVASQPRRGNCVRSLALHHVERGLDAELVIRIALSCPNARELDILRGLGSEDREGIVRQDASDLAELLASCPNLEFFIHHTWMNWEVGDISEGGRDVINGEVMTDAFDTTLGDQRYKDAANKLTGLAASGQSTWVVDALAPHLSPKFTTLILSQDIFVSAEFLQKLAFRSPALQKLSLSCNALVEDILAACRVWASSLQSLYIARLRDEHFRDCSFPVDFPAMENLIDIKLGCDLSSGAIYALAHSGPPQRLHCVELLNPEDPEEAVDESAARDHLENAICALVSRHSTTLKFLSLGSYAKVGQDVMSCCWNAPNLQTLKACHTCVLGPGFKRSKFSTHFPAMARSM